MFVSNLLRKAYGTDAYKGYAVNATWCEKSSGSYVSWKLWPCDDPGFCWKIMINGYISLWWMKLLQLHLQCWLGYIEPYGLLAVWMCHLQSRNRPCRRECETIGTIQRIEAWSFLGRVLVVKFIQPLISRTFMSLTRFDVLFHTFQGGFDSWRKKPRWHMMTLYDIDLVWYSCIMTSQIGSWAVTLDEASIRSVFEVNEILVLLELWRKSVENLLEFPWASVSYGVIITSSRKSWVLVESLLFDM